MTQNNLQSTSNQAQLEVEQYRHLIKLDEPFTPEPLNDRSDAARALLIALTFLLKEEGEVDTSFLASRSFEEQHRLLQHLLTIRAATPRLPISIQKQIDLVRQYDRQQKRLVDASALPTVANMFPNTAYPAAEQTVLWQGDISRLIVDGIVNAANDRMLGCFQPFHNCIDNVIHTAAGPRLREDCYQIMQAQGRLEETGRAKITRAYHLPSTFVLHTVGPIIPHGRALHAEDQQLLAQAYRSVLALAAETQLSSVAFCCISTGVFGFPKEPAAQIALDTVATWLQTNQSSVQRIVFNVFTDEDLAIYRSKLSII